MCPECRKIRPDWPWAIGIKIKNCIRGRWGVEEKNSPKSSNQSKLKSVHDGSNFSFFFSQSGLKNKHLKILDEKIVLMRNCVYSSLFHGPFRCWNWTKPWHFRRRSSAQPSVTEETERKSLSDVKNVPDDSSSSPAWRMEKCKYGWRKIGQGHYYYDYFYVYVYIDPTVFLFAQSVVCGRMLGTF